MTKYIFAISLVMNGILLMSVVGILPFLFFLSVNLSLGLAWYIKRLLSQMSLIVEDVGSMVEVVEGFTKHTESIHELEMYYGDETLQGLIRHAKATSYDLQYVLDKYSLKEEDSDVEEEE
tara:strand:- start:1871 stop:2230 length:360 start_codon:yes stop_codon:yes gene_type:complete